MENDRGGRVMRDIRVRGSGESRGKDELASVGSCRFSTRHVLHGPCVSAAGQLGSPPGASMCTTCCTGTRSRE
jgi:hypothetical protein